MGKWRYGQRKQEHGQHKRPASFVSRISTYAISPTLSLSFRFASFVPFFLRFLRAWHRRSPLSNLPCLHPPRVLHVPDYGSVIWCPVFPVFFKPIFAYPLGVLVLLNPPPPPSFFVDWFSRRLLRLLHLLLFASSFFLSFFLHVLLLPVSRWLRFLLSQPHLQRACVEEEDSFVWGRGEKEESDDMSPY